MDFQLQNGEKISGLLLFLLVFQYKKEKMMKVHLTNKMLTIVLEKKSMAVIFQETTVISYVTHIYFYDATIRTLRGEILNLDQHQPLD